MRANGGGVDPPPSQPARAGGVRSRGRCRLPVVSERGASVPFRVLVDEEPPGDAHGLDVDQDGRGSATQQRLYQLVREPARISDRTLEITFLAAGVEAYVFTFG